MCLLLSLLFAGNMFAQSSSGGDFTITQSVIAHGNTSADNSNTFSLSGTFGQSVAGRNSSSPPFQIHSGFWFSDFAPTAAGVIVSGRVMGFGNKGLGGVTITLIGGSNITPRTTTTDLRGNFVFEDVEVGQFYIVTAQRENFMFAPDSHSFDLLEEGMFVTFQSVWN
jgi:hypothetical protein